VGLLVDHFVAVVAPLVVVLDSVLAAAAAAAAAAADEAFDNVHNKKNTSFHVIPGLSIWGDTAACHNRL